MTDQTERMMPMTDGPDRESRFLVGDRVEARYTEQSKGWKPATVVTLHDEGITVLFDGFGDTAVVPDSRHRIRSLRADCHDRRGGPPYPVKISETPLPLPEETRRVLEQTDDPVAAACLLVGNFPGRPTGELADQFQALTGSGFQKRFKTKLNHVILMNTNLFVKGEGKRSSQKTWILRDHKDKIREGG